ncbi:MAG TPA: adenylate/guanylate cyclase domain-containing protein [Bacteroidetes bacterium]|nr:hypothetical protein BMS3Bbin04_01567 [bacterium BMS3Bbin04]HDO64538.1 adenylate/guanylate cyclase domain-containing protein [Bacteroidota bacterium]HEX03663.1 adenylate/guanylate cyclase domain-containing protein [Bacteroidota bacterium]
MKLPEYLEHLSEEISGIVSSDFQSKVKKYSQVSKIVEACEKKKTKDDEFTAFRMKTCVLYIDIRRSVLPEVHGRSRDKTKVYFAFLRVIANAAEFYGGVVVNQASDRMMVVFDDEDCFTEAVNTAYLLNTAAQNIFAPLFPHRAIRCGIGIDYGSLLVSRIPVTHRGDSVPTHHDIVWQGKPAHNASKLMATANGALAADDGVGQVGRAFHEIREWGWRVADEYANMMNMLGVSAANKYTGPKFQLARLDPEPGRIEPILVSGRMLDGLRKHRPDDVSLKRLWWRKKAVKVPGFPGEVYGTNVIYTC